MLHFKSYWFGALTFLAGFLFLADINAQTINHTFGTPVGCNPPPVTFSFDAGGLDFDFNSGTLPTGWAFGGGTFTVGQEPCAAPSLSGTDFFWASSAGSSTPVIETSDVNTLSGGTISFDMKYAVQGGLSPCEGPDAANEGVTLQYSTDGGATWTTIDYWPPSGGAAGVHPYTGNWVTMSMPIPAAAQTCSTRFRWIQIVSSGSAFDNWGLDEVVIAGSGTGTQLVRSYGILATEALLLRVTTPHILMHFLVLIPLR